MDARDVEPTDRRLPSQALDAKNVTACLEDSRGDSVDAGVVGLDGDALTINRDRDGRHVDVPAERGCSDDGDRESSWRGDDHVVGDPIAGGEVDHQLAGPASRDSV